MTTFTLENRALKLDTESDLNPHIQPLLTSTSTTAFHLQGNTLGAPAAAYLATILAKQTSLEEANLADIFTSRLLSEIPPALSSLLEACITLPKLHTINLSDNAFGLNTVEPLRPFLSGHVPLQHLILNNNGLGPAAGTLVAQALTQLAEKKQKGSDAVRLETVVCGRNRLETGSMKAWTEAYTANDGVKSVKMVQNGIRQEGIVTLLREGLSKCKGLKVLDLQDNTFTAVGSKAMADVISAGSWPELEELGVGDCLLGAKGGVNVFTALAEGGCPKLEVLRAQYNEIDGKALKVLAGGLGKMPKLRKVEVNGNKLSEEDPSLEAIKEELEKRREAAGEDEDEERWGLDELDDLEEDSDEDEEEDEVDEEEEKIVKDADTAESEPVAQKKDKEVDELADVLGKTEIK